MPSVRTWSGFKKARSTQLRRCRLHGCGRRAPPKRRPRRRNMYCSGERQKKSMHECHACMNSHLRIYDAALFLLTTALPRCNSSPAWYHQCTSVAPCTSDNLADVAVVAELADRLLFWSCWPAFLHKGLHRANFKRRSLSPPGIAALCIHIIFIHVV